MLLLELFSQLLIFFRSLKMVIFQKVVMLDFNQQLDNKQPTFSHSHRHTHSRQA